MTIISSRIGKPEAYRKESGRAAVALPNRNLKLQLSEIVAAGDTTTSTQCYLGYALSRSGKKSEAQAIQEKLKTTKEYVSPAEFAALYVGLGDKDGALDLLEKAYAARDLQLQFLKVDPHYDALRSDPRFTELMKKVGLPL